MHLSFFLYGQFVRKFVSRRQSSQLGVSTQLWGGSFIYGRAKIDYRCTPIDRFPLRRLRSVRVSQSSVDVYTATSIPGDLLAMVWGSVSYGKKYSEGYPKIFVTAVQLYLGTSTVYGTTSSSRRSETLTFG